MRSSCSDRSSAPRRRRDGTVGRQRRGRRRRDAGACAAISATGGQRPPPSVRVDDDEDGPLAPAPYSVGDQVVGLPRRAAGRRCSPPSRPGAHAEHRRGEQQQERQRRRGATATATPRPGRPSARSAGGGCAAAAPPCPSGATRARLQPAAGQPAERGDEGERGAQHGDDGDRGGVAEGRVDREPARRSPISEISTVSRRRRPSGRRWPARGRGLGSSSPPAGTPRARSPAAGRSRCRRRDRPWSRPSGPTG